MSLGGYDERFADDSGEADAQVRSRVAAAADGTPENYLTAVVALCGSRLLVPVLAGGDDSLTADPERAGEVSAVLLQRPDGARALPVFTGVDSAHEWHPAARPIPATLDRVAQTARAEGADTVLIDIAGPSPLTIEGELLAQLAQGHRLVRLPDGFGWIATGTS
ncbi:SseB family protein [Naumannella halotolerans]|uniref:Type III secretion system (T3SS) SseB-like protein n=1 Tax=Naumannella halotolerans TaxID=993414 RepID=A0A4R7J772_9ACTN|nr:SseB family protein [Naumannella halotolerans]TDT33075.1 type III secretion system (T3SS) SseB-like protein [Naumannella halotolerans]